MTNRTIVIWGAGGIGRGFIADLFAAADYNLFLVDQSSELIANLRSAGGYTVVRAKDAAHCEEALITSYTALSTSDSTELQSAVTQTDLIALAVFPQAFEAVAAQLVPLLIQRQKERPTAPLDVLLCTNLLHAAQKFRTAFEKACPPASLTSLNACTGIAETLVIRIVPSAPHDLLKKDALGVFTNGYPTLHVDKSALRTNRLNDLPGVRLVENMHAEEMRKMYTYNMVQAVLAYHGAPRQHSFIVDCIADPGVNGEAQAVLAEVSLALQAQYGFSNSAMEEWNRAVLEQTNNPALGDTVTRMAADPLRKLRRDDRLVGPALLAIQHNIEPKHLIRGIAAALRYDAKDDPSANIVQERIVAVGLRSAVQELCGLTEMHASLLDAIVLAYHRLPLELEWEKKAKRAFDLGFENEKIYHGCGQCVYDAVARLLDAFDPAVFNAATPLSGGLGLYGKVTCSALTGAALVIGSLYPRRCENFSGDRDNKYQAFNLTQQLNEKFLQRYGSLICHDIHTARMGRPFDLRNKVEREAFELAGAHDNECTETVALAAQWAIEVIGAVKIEEELSKIQLI